MHDDPAEAAALGTFLVVVQRISITGGSAVRVRGAGAPGRRGLVRRRRWRGERNAGTIGAVTVDVLSEIVIDRPVEIVSNFSVDPSNAPEWYVNIESVEWKTDPPLVVGSQIEFVARFLGRRLRYTYEVAEWIPGERFVMRTAEGPFPMETTYPWASTGASTTMHLRNRGDPAGFSRLVAPLMAPAMRRANRKDLQRLKALLEAT